MYIHIHSHTHTYDIPTNPHVYIVAYTCHMCASVHTCIYMHAHKLHGRPRLAMDFPTNGVRGQAKNSVYTLLPLPSPAERPTEAKFMQNCWLGLGLHGLVGKSIALAMQSLVVVMGSVARAKTFACSFLPGTLGGFLLEHTLEIPLYIYTCMYIYIYV